MYSIDVTGIVHGGVDVGCPSTVIAPISQAGHHTHHITTGVYILQTFHPNAAPSRTSAALSSAIAAAEYSTAVGAIRFRNPEHNHFKILVCGNGRIKLNGLVIRPMRNAKEKFKVAREAKNMPRRSSEKDLMSWYC
jgi:hypothetical protein